MKKTPLYLLIVALLLLFFLITSGATKKTTTQQPPLTGTSSESADTVTPTQESTTPMIKQYKTQPSIVINPQKKYTALLKTDKGDITIELHADKTPVTVNNFVFLAREGFYDNTIFHRVIKGFMIQGGDPTGTGRGTPGYRFDDEPFAGEYVRGVVAMANAGDNTNGSQFFIIHQDTALPKNYVIFGMVTDGIETVDTIAEAETKPNALGEQSTPTKPVGIGSITIIEE